MKRRTPASPLYNLLLRQEQGRLRSAAKLQYDRETLDRINLQQLIAATPPEIQDKSFDVRLIARHFETGRMDGFRRTKVKYPSIYNQVRVYSRDMSPTGSGGKHQSLIRFYGPPGIKSPVWVWCDCDYFKYTLEVPLYDHNSSSVKNSNGEPATIRNPGNTPYLCKHLFRAAEWALTRREDKASKAMDKLVEDRSSKKGAGVMTASNRTRLPNGTRRFGK